jgi:hypothetical protein
VAPSPTGATCTTAATTTCRLTLHVYVFITTVTDSVCSQSGVTCTTSYKRVTVAVKNAGAGAPLKPIYLATFVANKVGGSANPLTASTTTCLDGTTSVSCTH